MEILLIKPRVGGTGWLVLCPLILTQKGEGGRRLLKVRLWCCEIRNRTLKTQIELIFANLSQFSPLDRLDVFFQKAPARSRKISVIGAPWLNFLEVKGFSYDFKKAVEEGN